MRLMVTVFDYSRCWQTTHTVTNKGKGGKGDNRRRRESAMLVGGGARHGRHASGGGGGGCCAVLQRCSRARQLHTHSFLPPNVTICL